MDNDVNDFNCIISFSRYSVYKKQMVDGEKDALFQLRFNSPNYDALLESVAFVVGRDTNEGEAGSRHAFEFRANKVQTLELHLMEHGYKMNYNACLSLLYNLDSQNEFLIASGFSIFCLCLKDILVIDDSCFVFVNPENLRTTDAKGDIVFLSPFSRYGFCSPELLAVCKLPCKVSCTTFHYSLGALAIFCMFHVNINKRSTGGSSDSNDSNVVCNEIIGTKLYYTISRLLHPDASKRIFLYV